jgi:hypothetical protein
MLWALIAAVVVAVLPGAQLSEGVQCLHLIAAA